MSNHLEKKRVEYSVCLNLVYVNISTGINYIHRFYVNGGVTRVTLPPVLHKESFQSWSFVDVSIHKLQSRPITGLWCGLVWGIQARS